MQEIAYLITTEGDFDGAKSSNVLERSPFIEMNIPGEFGCFDVMWEEQL